MAKGMRAVLLALLFALALAVAAPAVEAGDDKGKGHEKKEKSEGVQEPPSGPYKPTSDGDDVEKDPPRGDHKHSICHATGSESNPYVLITPSVSGVYHAHIAHQHGEDIIPPFEYKGTTYSSNWDARGQAIFANGCVVPAPPSQPPVSPPPGSPPPGSPPPGSPPPGSPPPDVCVNVPGSQTTVPLGMIKTSSGSCATPPPSVRAPVVDVEVVKTDAPDPVSVGGRITYTIRVTNRSQEAATNVVVTDPLPSTVTLVSVATTQGSCSTTQPLRCELGRIPGGASVTITAVVRANAAGLVVNTASGAGSEADPNPVNNVSTATTRVVAPLKPPAARCDRLTVSPRSLQVGRTSTVTIRATANGRPIRVLVVVRGAGISTSYRTNRAGVLRLKLRPQKAGIVRFFVRGSSCTRRLGAVAPFQPPQVTG